MTRLMYDSTNIQDDPASAHLVGHYVDGIYAVSVATVRTRYPSATLVGISAIGSNAGIVGDQEPGCMSIEQAVAWVVARRAAGFDPSVYVNEMYGWAGARHAFDAYGVDEPHWWVADYDGIPVIPAGAVAKQYANPTLTHGHFDLSVVADYWPGVDGQFTGEEMAQIDDIYSILVKGTTVGGSSSALSRLAGDVAAIKGAVVGKGPAGPVDLTAVLLAVADLKAHPGVQADPSLAAQVTALAKHLGVGVA